MLVVRLENASPEVLGAVVSAARRANKEGRTPGDADLLVGLLQLDGLRSGLARIGVDLKALDDALARHVAASVRETWYRRLLPRIAQGAVTEAGARAQRAGLPKLSAAFLFATLAERADADPLARALASAGFSLASFRWWAAHGEAVPAQIPDANRVELTLHDDPFTPMAVVVDVLVQVFGLPKDEARARMREAHENEQASLGTHPVDEARAKLADARARANAVAAPLRISAAAS
jgi:ATP-dependent Clp protease adapter protein ClpS